MAEIKTEKNIYMKLQQDVRAKILEFDLQKTGYNKHLNYYYWDLPNFEPVANKLMAEAGLCPIYNIGYDANGVEMATMMVTDGLEKIVFSIPTAEVPNMNGIFNIGSKDKYCLRYLLVNHVLMLAETDEAELSNTEETKNAKVEQKKATKKQIEMIKQLYDAENIAKMLEYYNITTLEEMKLEDASAVIKRKNG